MKGLRQLRVASVPTVLAIGACTPAATVTSGGTATSTVVAEPADNMIIPNSSLTWVDWQPPGFDPGVKLAVFHGDPSKAGDYVLRLRFPDGYRFPVHYHPGAEHLTVLSGTFYLAMGTSNDWNQVKAYGPGDFIFAPAFHPHYGGAKGVTEVQLNGQGPFGLILGTPK
ncbi:MAG TPA: cupin domain-containing protein [Gemmatimonadaceae bacterium]